MKHDVILSTPALHRDEMKFRARVFENPPLTIALLTDLGDENPGCSITNGIEYAVAAVLERWPDIDPARLVIVEHYDDREKLRRMAAKYGRYQAEPLQRARDHGECFDLVTFGRGFEAVLERAKRNPGRAVEPVWKRIPKAEVERLICEVLP